MVSERNSIMLALLSMLVLFPALIESSEGLQKSMQTYCKKDLKRIEFNSDQHFLCMNGRCLNRSQFCDGDLDCEDFSDEDHCDIGYYGECPSNWHACAAAEFKCYPSYWHCDGHYDCPGGTDEINCTVSSSTAATTTTLAPTLAKIIDNEATAYVGDDESLKNLTQIYLNMRQSEHSLNKWGHHLPKIATALYLADPGFFQPENQTGLEIAYEISLQLLSKFFQKQKMGTHELSWYVNSLLVSCIDPRKFFGINVVAELRKGADSSNYTNPFTILTLCNAGDDMTMDDVRKVLSAFDMQRRRLWTDNQALATITLACLSTRPHLTVDDADLSRMIVALKRKQHKNGTVDNLATTALVVQALMATDSYMNDFDIKEAMKFITQKIRNESLSIFDSFYVLPTLNQMSLLNISNRHCKAPVKAEMDVLVDLHTEQDERIQVQYSVFVGDKMDFIRTWKIKVPANSTFYNVLESIASMEPEYRVRYSVIDDKPYVSGLTKMKMVDHAEREMYWFIYKQQLGSSDGPKLIESSPVDIQVNKDEELILWYRSGSWISK